MPVEPSTHFNFERMFQEKLLFYLITLRRLKFSKKKVVNLRISYFFFFYQLKVHILLYNVRSYLPSKIFIFPSLSCIVITISC